MDEPDDDEELNRGAQDIWDVWPEDEDIGEDIDELGELAFFTYDKTKLESEKIRNVTFGRILGEGAFGMVRYAECEVMCSLGGRKGPGRLYRSKWRNRKLACKVIQPPSATKRSVLRSLQEMYALRYLRHKNICNYCDIIGIPDSKTRFPYSTVCLFYELCDGTLLDAKRNGCPQDYPTNEKHWAFPERLSKHWFSQIAIAFDYIHEEGFAHNDFHDENVLFQVKPYLINNTDENDLVNTFEERFLSSIFKLSDFGQAIYSSEETDSFATQKRGDVRDLCDCLFQTSIPGIRGISKEGSFSEFCETGECDEQIREEWETISPEFKDLIQRMPLIRDYFTFNHIRCEMNLTDILKHPWLQNISEPRTKPFIWKEKEKKVIPVVPEVIQKKKRRQTPRYERKNRRIKQIRRLRNKRRKRIRELRRPLYGNLPFSPSKYY